MLIIAFLVFSVKKNGAEKDKKLSPLAGLAFSFIIAGIIFSDDRFIGYILIGAGVIISVIDLVQKSKNK